MADVLGKQLGQARPANTTAVSIYNPGPNVITELTAIFICDTAGGTPKYRIFLDDDGTTYDETTALYYDVQIQENTETVLIDLTGVWMADSDGNLAVRTDAANEITFTLFGKENIQ
ncbi:MAG: hypothetical protein GY906_24390 [bacterium]|nr:hypothetical protein [bacterium]